MADKPTVVRCPEQLAPLFAQAEGIMRGYFDELERSPEHARISISGVRYVLVRTESLSLELHEELRKSFGDAGAQQIRYRLANVVGKKDARMYSERLDITDPAMKLALGPVHFAFVGWALVDIFPESAPQPNEDYFLLYDHPYSFEADAYMQRGIKSEQPVCHMNAGYSAGWCEVSFGVELEARELSCRASGHDKCIFVMAHKNRIERKVSEYRDKLGLRRP